jgi:hypothetical protein
MKYSSFPFLSPFSRGAGQRHRVFQLKGTSAVIEIVPDNFNLHMSKLRLRERLTPPKLIQSSLATGPGHHVPLL